MTLYSPVVGKTISHVLERADLEAWGDANDVPDWWDFYEHTLLCNTGYGFVELSVPEVLDVQDVQEAGFVAGFTTPMVRLHGCDSPTSADSYWCRIPVLVLRRAS